MSRYSHTLDRPRSSEQAPEPLAQPDLSPDEELLALPAPPRRERAVAITLMAAASALALGLLMGLQSDIAYFFAPGTPQDLGAAPDLSPADWTPNRFVTVRGAPMLSRTVRYHGSLGGDHYALFPLAGQRDLLVQVPAGSLRRAETAARGEFAGRLVRVGDLGGRFSEVAGYLKQRMGMPVGSATFVLLVGEAPAAGLGSLLLALFCLGVVLFNAWLLLRWFRPLRWQRSAEHTGE